MSHILIIAVFSVISMIAYFATSDDPPKKRGKNMIAGAAIAWILSYPTWVGIGAALGIEIAAFWLIPITFTYTVTGQFIPEFLQSVVPKAVRKITNIIFKKNTGEDLDNDH